MPRIDAKVLTICLLLLPVAAFAQIYPTGGEPDIFVNNLTYSLNPATGTPTSLNLGGSSVKLPDGTILSGGAVEALGDVSGTWCSGAGGVECQLGGLALAFTADSTGFQITGQTIEDYDAGTSGTTTYLSGTLDSFTQQLNPITREPTGEYGELFTVTDDNTDEMNELEEAFPSSSGTLPATDWTGDTVFIDFDAAPGSPQGSYTLDMEPYNGPAVPEPTTLTLLCTGLAAGLLRKRLARKKA